MSGLSFPCDTMSSSSGMKRCTWVCPALMVRPFSKMSPNKKFVNETRVHTRQTDDAASSCCSYCLAQGLAAGPFKLQRRQDGFRRAALGFEAHRIDGGVDATVVRAGHDLRRRVVVVFEVDGLDAIGRRR